MTDIEHPPTLSSVVLLRLRDYARRPVAEQARLRAQLDAVLAVLLPDMPARQRIVLDGGGAAAVAVLGNAPAALDLAERALRASQAGVELCIGIDHGPVELTDGEAGDALAGDGVATAAVIAAFAADGGLLMSRNFRTALLQTAPGVQSALVPAGQVSDASLRTYQVFGLDREAPRRRRRRFIVAAVVCAVVLLTAAMTLRLTLPDRPRPLASYLDSATTPTPKRPLRTLRDER
jgi:hypothetical protein